VQQNLAEINPNYKGTLCKYFQKDGVCEFGSLCQYAHGESELRKINPAVAKTQPQSYVGSSFNSLQYKTQLCKNYQEGGSCDFGSGCQFAHGLIELRSTSQNQQKRGTAQSCVPQQQFSAFHPSLRPSTQTFSSPMFGSSSSSSMLGSSSSSSMLGSSSSSMYGSSPRELCMSWLQTGVCHSRNCGSAHSLNELSSAKPPVMRPRSATLCRNIRERGECSWGDQCQFSHQQLSPAPAVSRPVKVVMCQDFRLGQCTRGEQCSFAHGLQELNEYRSRQVPNYKTSLCQSWSARGTCQWGDTCMYAHGGSELRNRFATGPGGNEHKRVKL